MLPTHMSYLPQLHDVFNSTFGTHKHQRVGEALNEALGRKFDGDSSLKLDLNPDTSRNFTLLARNRMIQVNLLMRFECCKYASSGLPRQFINISAFNYSCVASAASFILATQNCH